MLYCNSGRITIPALPPTDFYYVEIGFAETLNVRDSQGQKKATAANRIRANSILMYRHGKLSVHWSRKQKRRSSV
jgi:hypothetical protein